MEEDLRKTKKFPLHYHLGFCQFIRETSLLVIATCQRSSSGLLTSLAFVGASLFTFELVLRFWLVFYCQQLHQTGQTNKIYNHALEPLLVMLTLSFFSVFYPSHLYWFNLSNCKTHWSALTCLYTIFSVISHFILVALIQKYFVLSFVWMDESM